MKDDRSDLYAFCSSYTKMLDRLLIGAHGWCVVECPSSLEMATWIELMRSSMFVRLAAYRTRARAAVARARWIVI